MKTKCFIKQGPKTFLVSQVALFTIKNTRKSILTLSLHLSMFQVLFCHKLKLNNSSGTSPDSPRSNQALHKSMQQCFLEACTHKKNFAAIQLNIQLCESETAPHREAPKQLVREFNGYFPRWVMMLAWVSKEPGSRQRLNYLVEDVLGKDLLIAPGLML